VDPEHHASALDAALGLRFEHYDEHGAARLVLEPPPLAAGDAAGTFLHGGALSTCVDTAGWYAVRHTRSGQYVAVDLRCDFLRPARVAAHTVTGRVRRSGRTLSVADVEIVAVGDDQPVALGRVTFLRVAD
jgi:uncharacterized protein (TIGR00369 family)